MLQTPGAVWAVFLSKDVLLCVKLLCTRGLKLQENPFHPVLRSLLGAFGLGRCRKDVKGVASSFLKSRSLTTGVVHTEKPC